jgi:hypothetical protein
MGSGWSAVSREREDGRSSLINHSYGSRPPAREALQNCDRKTSGASRAGACLNEQQQPYEIVSFDTLRNRELSRLQEL